MASIGKLALSLANAAQETTLALAHFNFDFALIKMDAPAEFHGLGNRLSKKRKLEAEEGLVHTAARQLGALFADDLPIVPNLARAYGLRASEISEDPTINPTGTASDGPLASHVGLDGTSIWAAATSGRGALQVHLLACILARVWPGAEAVAIWSELVTARKEQLSERLKEDQFHMGLLMASRVDIGLEKLAEWDASARAWLSAADKAKFLQQKQLMLIIDNIGIQIRTFPRLYDSVLHVWTRALETMEKLVSGVAQCVESPEVLLGLSAWHLYPDMVVLDVETKHVIQKDPLVCQGGLVTIGMKGSNAGSETGITWTMPLAQLRYYGTPVQTSRAIGSNSLRVSFDGIVLIAMGSAISTWGSYVSNLEELSKFWIALAERCELETSGRLKHSSLAWMELFATQATFFLRAKEQEKREVIRFINFGRGRYKEFLGFPKNHLPPAFGLGNISGFLSILDVEGQISALRQLAATYNLGFEMGGAFILYRPGLFSETSRFEFATLFPQTIGSPKPFHRRWIAPINTHEAMEAIEASAPGQRQSNVNQASRRIRLKVDTVATTTRTIQIMDSTREPCGILPVGTVTDREGTAIEYRWQQFEQSSPFLGWNYHSGQALDIEGLERSCLNKDYPTEKLAHYKIGWQIGSTPHRYERGNFKYLFGSRSVMVYLPTSDWNATTTLPLIPLEVVSKTLSTLDSKEQTLISYIQTLASKGYDDRQPNAGRYLLSLEKIYRASLVYRGMASSTIDPTVALTPLHNAKWTAVEESTNSSPSRPVALSLIAMFDGCLDIAPSAFEDVIAVSSRDSLYVSEVLLSDPTSNNWEIRCLVGNIGKAGMALLLSPRDPIIRTQDQDNWEMINHQDFDGRLEDNFRSTSLHLKLTGYEYPINTTRLGNRSAVALYAEAAVSAHAQGEWIADIDILNLVGTSWLAERLLPVHCPHSDEEKQDNTECGLLTSIDNWAELLDRPPNTSIIRAKGNWSARLALAAVMRMRRNDAVISSGEICWACVKAFAAISNLDTEQLLILC